MCLPYLKDKAESFSDTMVRNTPNGLLVLNENMEVQQRYSIIIFYGTQSHLIILQVRECKHLKILNKRV